ncbi:serine hydrolase [Paenibacillus sp. SYP-B3998]|uniref:Serine hydrolase n=1 Tax=Paenibacillus sp. SYP-B3998 TaxID=2678564 RepID=A0A6G4A2X9_9BACL|nr:serine hydrolase [Paenibacillus sp. SYP-B3998]NEW08007.1 serine hydrolase [Paenibacillus sp. SYP-B3998]
MKKKKKRTGGGTNLSLPVAAGSGDKTYRNPSNKSITQAARSSVDTIKSTLYWPTEDWRTTTPESQGMDSSIIAEAIEAFQHRNMHSMVIIRNGYLVTEAYNSSTQIDTRQDVRSVTKSITSALAGIALSEQKLRSLDQKLTEFFPELVSDPFKSKITISHLLYMASGLEWTDQNDQSSSDMMYSPNWIQFILEQPSANPPGSKYNYSNGDSHLLSAVLQKATHQSLFDYAKAHLFTPLGITNVNWNHDPQGHSIGAWALALTARDMAKIGLLYLKEGVWDTTTVLPKPWIKESLTKRVYHNYHDGTQGGYGYYWWLKPYLRGRFEGDTRTYDTFYAAGSGGQRIFVVPELQLIVTLTADSSDVDMPEQLLKHVTKSIRSNRWITDNLEAADRLAQAVQSFKTF